MGYDDLPVARLNLPTDTRIPEILQEKLSRELTELQKVSEYKKFFSRGVNIGIVGLGNCGYKIAETIALDERIPVKGLYLASTDEDKAHQIMHRMSEYNLIRGADGIQSISRHDSANGGLYRIANETNIAIIAAGVPGGKDRNDAISKNMPIIKDIATQFQGYRGRVIVLTNPVDVMTYLFREYSGIDPAKVVGSSHVDTIRFRHGLDRFLRVNSDDNYGGVSNVFVIGPHDDMMIPLFGLAESHGFKHGHDAVTPWQPREFREEWKRDLRHDVITYPNDLIFHKQTTAISTAKAMQNIVHAMIYGGVVSVSTFGKFADFAQGMIPYVQNVLEPNDPGLFMGYPVQFVEGKAQIVPLPLKEDYDTARAYSHFQDDPLKFKPDANDGPFAVLNRYLYMANKLADRTTPEVAAKFQGLKARQEKAAAHAEVA
jgi:malate/lactate dehydrogenase